MSDEQTTTQTIQEPEKKAQKPMIVDANRLMAPTDSRELAQFLSLLAKGGAFPESFDTPEARLAAYQMARSLMADRWQLAINHIAAVKGRLTIYGELPRAIAEQTGEVEEFRLFVIDRDYKEITLTNKNLDSPVWAAICEVKRKGRSLKQYSYTLNEAEHAGQYPAMRYDKQKGSKVLSPDSPWNKFTKIMLMRKAQALAIKFEFPDALLGVPVAEYDDNVAPDLEPGMKDVTPDPASILNKRFGGLREQDN